MSARPQILALLPSLVLLAGCQRPLGELPVPAVSQPVASVQAEDDDVPLPPADTGPIAISWEELDVGIQAETVYEPWMMKTSIKSLEGESVRITGYIHAGVPVSKGIKEFVLLRNIDCPYGRQGEAHHVMIVELQGDLRIDYAQQAVTVEGIFHVRPFNGPDGSTWALYAMEGTRVRFADGRIFPPSETIHDQKAEAAR